MRKLEAQLTNIENLLQKKEKILEDNASLRQLNLVLLRIAKELQRPSSQKSYLTEEIKEILLDPILINKITLEDATILLINIFECKSGD